MITHRERLKACIAGEQPDRPPVALWRHFPVDDQDELALAQSHLAFEHTYDFDLIKLTAASSYSVKDWGVQDRWAGDPEGTRNYTGYVIKEPADWRRLPVLTPDAPALAAMLSCLRQVRAEVGPDVPILQTVFNPLSQAKHLAGDPVLMEHLRRDPGAIEAALETITESTKGFILAATDAGADGIFYAVQHGQASLLSRAQFEQFSSRWDKKVLEAAADLWCNMLHLHGEHVYFDDVLNYPTQIINWHDREAGPDLAEGFEKWPGVVCGGLGRSTLVLGDPNAIREEAREALQVTSGKRLILSTGCVVPTITPHGNIRAARHAFDSLDESRL
jgi:uroporphyrinogen decarboxylase